MEIVITEWALDSYIQLLSTQVFTKEEYRKIIRPDVKRLRNYPGDPKFKLNKFWSPVSDHQTSRNVPDGYKMKWHNIGPGKVQLRLPIGVLKDAVLFGAYFKKNSKQEKRMIARFKTHLQLVRLGRFTERGRLP